MTTFNLVAVCCVVLGVGDFTGESTSSLGSENQEFEDKRGF